MSEPSSTPTQIAIQDLVLDPKNPRIVVEPNASQETLTRYLYERESLDELVMSFVENGYFPEEPLVAVLDKVSSKYVVVEGNRRLATLKLLLDSSLQDKLGATDWPSLTGEQRSRLDPVPVVVYANRADVLPYLGFRHITGAKKWAPFQKARFIAQLVDEDFDLATIQELIGDSTQVVKKLYQEFTVFEQIRLQTELDTEPIRQRFSLMEVALGQRPIKDHLGLPRTLPAGKDPNPVPEENLDKLAEVVEWVFGSGLRAPVVAESRDISQRLAKVVASEEALQRLRETGDLDLAYELTDGEQVSLERKLDRAEKLLREAAGLVPLYSEDPDIRLAVGRLAKIADALRTQVE